MCKQNFLILSQYQRVGIAFVHAYNNHEKGIEAADLDDDDLELADQEDLDQVTATKNIKGTLWYHFNFLGL